MNRTATRPPESADHDVELDEQTLSDEVLRRILIGMAVAVIAIVAVVVFVAGARWAATDTSEEPYGNADIGFLQDMIDHHEQALVISQIYLDNNPDGAARPYAREVILFQERDIERMEAWLDEAGVERGGPGRSAMGWNRCRACKVRIGSPSSRRPTDRRRTGSSSTSCRTTTSVGSTWRTVPHLAPDERRFGSSHRRWPTTNASRSSSTTRQSVAWDSDGRTPPTSPLFDLPFRHRARTSAVISQRTREHSERYETHQHSPHRGPRFVVFPVGFLDQVLDHCDDAQAGRAHERPELPALRTTPKCEVCHRRAGQCR